MAGLSETPNRKTRRAAAATGTAPVAPAIEAATDRAAIERDPADTGGVPAPDAPILPVEALPDTGTAVLPEPTLTAEPDRPAPIVTASPILAIEPGAIDVVQAEASAERVATGAEEPGDRDRLHDAAAGQPTLTIEGSVAATKRGDEFAQLGEALDIDHAWGDRGDIQRPFDEQPLSLDRLVADLERLAASDPSGMNLIRRRFFEGYQFSHLPAGPTVTVIEVVGPAHGRRRAGMSFGPKARRFLASDLRADELDALRTDPQLAVGVSEMDEDDAIEAFGSTIPIELF